MTRKSKNAGVGRPGKSALNRRLLCAALARVEALKPAYDLFASVVGWDGDRMFDRALEVCWQLAAGESTVLNADVWIERVDGCTPQPDPQGYYGAWPAFDACIALTSVLEWLGEPTEDVLGTLDDIVAGGIDRHLEVLGAVGDETLYSDYQHWIAALDTELDHANGDARSLRRWQALQQYSTIGLLQEGG